MRISNAALLLGLVGVCAFSRPDVAGFGTITGKVFDVETKDPLQYANIVIVGTTLGAMALEDGSFEIVRVPVGRYTVKVMMMGYRPVERPDVVVHADSVADLTFEMERTIVSTTQVINVLGDRVFIPGISSDTRGSTRDGSTSEPRRGNAVDAIALKTGIIKTGQELHARGGRSGEVRMQLDGVPAHRPRVSARPQKNVPMGCASHYETGCRGSIRFPHEPWNTENYDRIYENEFLDVIEQPLSTFSIDVDAASYSNVRRFIRHGTIPPADAVRIEEMINYFAYHYPQPTGDDPFSIATEVAGCPWNPAHRLVRIGLRGASIAMEDAPPSNLVFLIDVSGSMGPPNKLPLLKASFRLLVDHLRPEDRVAAVVYASSAALALPATTGDNKTEILQTIDGLHAGGSTAGGAGIRLAYDIAVENLLENGNNRVILATDGDFNTGSSSDAEMVRLVEEKRKTGIFLSVLGFGTGNLKDSKLEKLADKGNGHFVYIDNLLEAKRVLIDQLGATMLTIAKDVKVQVEFNPVKVESYRLIGYENRLLARQDFADDKKDAGEIGAGHTVTALYEVVPVDGEREPGADDGLKYLDVVFDRAAFAGSEILTVRFRYKRPGEDDSRLLTHTVGDRGTRFEDASDDLKFSASVAEFGMILRDSQFKGESSYEQVIRIARAAKGKDESGFRAEFIQLVEMCELLLASR